MAFRKTGRRFIWIEKLNEHSGGKSYTPLDCIA
jgi:hypothetical protein